MKTLVVYDSAYGNTERIARAIGSAIAGDVHVSHVGGLDDSSLERVDLLIIGSPTQGGKPTKAIQDFLDNIPESFLTRGCVAAFDTRLSTKWVGIFGYAAGRIAENLKARGAYLVASPAAFFVKGKEGPLKAGEVERASVWAKETAGSLSAVSARA